MAEDRGFTVRDRRRVRPDGEPAGPEAGKGAAEAREGAPQEGKQPLPPVDFSGFVLGLGQMALIHLGEMPEPQTGRVMRDLEQARHTIDILDMLEEKTRGNLTEAESKLLLSLTTDLKLKFVRAARGE